MVPFKVIPGGQAVHVVAVAEHSVHGDVQGRQFDDPSMKKPAGHVHVFEERV